jgi:hypothetical protein
MASSTENDKKYTVSRRNSLHIDTRGLGAFRHQQKGAAQSKPGLQKDCPETQNSLQGKTFTLPPASLSLRFMIIYTVCSAILTRQI